MYTILVWAEYRNKYFFYKNTSTTIFVYLLQFSCQTLLPNMDEWVIEYLKQQQKHGVVKLHRYRINENILKSVLN